MHSDFREGESKAPGMSFFIKWFPSATFAKSVKILTSRGVFEGRNHQIKITIGNGTWLVSDIAPVIQNDTRATYATIG